jgi:predicted membrane protein
MNEHKTQGRIFWGLLLIVLGVLFLLDQMGRLDFGDLVGRYWPVIFILIGVSILLSNNLRNVGSGVFFILFGTFFLLLRLRIFDQAVWHYLWPLAIIAVGLWILLRPSVRRDKKKIPEMTGDDLAINQVFSGTKRKVESQSFKGGKADVVFGSAEIDLRAAQLAGGQATLVLSVVFGNIEIIVPRQWQVVLAGTPVLGSLESHKPPVSDAEKTGTLSIQGSAVFGSIEVKE